MCGEPSFLRSHVGMQAAGSAREERQSATTPPPSWQAGAFLSHSRCCLFRKCLPRGVSTHSRVSSLSSLFLPEPELPREVQSQLLSQCLSSQKASQPCLPTPLTACHCPASKKSSAMPLPCQSVSPFYAGKGVCAQRRNEKFFSPPKPVQNVLKWKIKMIDEVERRRKAQGMDEILPWVGKGKGLGDEQIDYSPPRSLSTYMEALMFLFCLLFLFKSQVEVLVAIALSFRLSSSSRKFQERPAQPQRNSSKKFISQNVSYRKC